MHKTKIILLALVSLTLLSYPLKLGAATYYADPAGNDANTGTSEGSPWSLTKCITTAVAGDSVILLDGAYTNRTTILISTAATAASPLLISAKNKWGPLIHSVSADDGLRINSVAAFVYINGLSISNNGQHGIRIAASNCKVSNCNLIDNGACGVSATGSTTATNTVELNLVHNNGSLTLTGGILVNGQGNIVRGNVVRNSVDFGIKVAHFGGGTVSVNANAVYNNLTYSNGNYGVILYGALQDGQYTNSMGTNSIASNTINDGMQVGLGGIFVSNNIILPHPNSLTLTAVTNTTDPTRTVNGAGGTCPLTFNNNFGTNTLHGGANDIIVNTPRLTFFPGQSAGRYWLHQTNQCRAAGGTALNYPYDFFGRVKGRTRDIGAFQFEEYQLQDTRTLTGVNADYWFTGPAALKVSPYAATHFVHWGTSFTNAHGYLLKRKLGSGGSYSTIATLAGDQEFYVDDASALSAGQTYYYQVTSTNTYNQDSFLSREVSIVADTTSLVHPARILDWGTNITGLPNGVIPTNYTIWSDISTNNGIPGTNIWCVGDGVTDNTTALETAWKLCPSNQVMLLGSGTFAIASTVNFDNQSVSQNNNKILRGNGTNNTIIKTTGGGFSSSAAVKFNAINLQGTERVLSGPVAIGDTTVTLPQGLGAVPMEAGSMIIIWEDDAGGAFGANNPGGNADDNYNSNDGSTFTTASAPLRREVKLVTAVNAGSGLVTFTPPMMQAFGAGALLQYQYLYRCNNSGLEDFTIDATGATTSRGIEFEGAARCWLKNIRSRRTSASHIRAQFLVQCTIFGCYLNDAPAFTANAGIGLQMLRDVDSCLIYNNVFHKLFPGVEYQKACNGNFFARNFYWDPQSGLAPIDNHGGHNVFNCHEGEDGYGVVLDGYFNGAAYWTFFRCNFTGYQPAFGARKVMNFDRFSRFMNVYNSVIGGPHTNWIDSKYVSGWANADAAIWRLGYPSMGNDTFSSSNTTYRVKQIDGLDMGVNTNLFRHANYEFDDSAIVYDANYAQRTYPYSHFKEWNDVVKPAWYTNGVWPGIGTDGGVMATNRNMARLFFDGAVIASGPPVISSVNASSITDTTATITWTTDSASDSMVTYNGVSTAVDPTYVTSHSVNLTGLTAATLYSYTVTSDNGIGSTTSSTFLFTTAYPYPNAIVPARLFGGILPPEYFDKRNN